MADLFIGRFWRLSPGKVQARFVAMMVAPLSGVLLVAAAPHDRPSGGTILPGYWEADVRFMGTSKVERWCIAPKDISKFLSGPSNHIYHCVYPQNTVADGKMSFSGECRGGKGERIKLSGGGDYTPTTVHSRVDGRYMLFGIPIPGSASTDAHRLGDVCPPGAKAFK